MFSASPPHDTLPTCFRVITRQRVGFPKVCGDEENGAPSMRHAIQPRPVMTPNGNVMTPNGNNPEPKSRTGSPPMLLRRR